MFSSNLIVAVAISTGFATAQSTTRPKYLDRAEIEHSGSLVTVVANDPVPLFQAISAIRQEYGWQVNWEEAPCYSRFDVVDDTGPKWRAAHPSEKGVTRQAGGLFTTSFQEPGDAIASAQEDILSKAIDDYNASGNPGRYTLRKSANGWLTVVGTTVKDDSGSLQEVSPLLDTPLALQKQKRTLYETVDVILKTLSTTTGRRVITMSVPNNLFLNTTVDIGGDRVPARDLLIEALQATHRPLQYDFGFDPDFSSVYILNVSVASRAEVDDAGRTRLIPTDQTH